MKLTPKLRAVIVTQWKSGESMSYLSLLYEQPLSRVEQLLRMRLMEAEERLGRLDDDSHKASDEQVATIKRLVAD